MDPPWSSSRKEVQQTLRSRLVALAVARWTQLWKKWWKILPQRSNTWSAVKWHILQGPYCSTHLLCLRSVSVFGPSLFAACVFLNFKKSLRSIWTFLSQFPQPVSVSHPAPRIEVEPRCCRCCTGNVKAIAPEFSIYTVNYSRSL